MWVQLEPEPALLEPAQGREPALAPVLGLVLARLSSASAFLFRRRAPHDLEISLVRKSSIDIESVCT
eukprot:SAG11_NODE_694_length_7695_cov_2.772775_3_plen_67_part_00